MAEHPERKELLRLLSAFTTPTRTTPERTAAQRLGDTRRAGESARKTRQAVLDIAKGQGVSNKEAVAILKGTARELSAARKAIGEIAAGSSSGTTTARQLGIDILNARRPVKNAAGTALVSQVSGGVARFAARAEIANPTSSGFRVFGNQTDLNAALALSRPSRPGRGRTSPLSGGPRNRAGR